MSQEFTINFTVDTTDGTVPLGFEMWLDGTLAHDIKHVTGSTELSYSIPDDDGQHELKFILKNKLPEHTSIDENGNILKDALLSITQLEFDGIKLGQMLNDLARYQHNYNGTGQTVDESFAGFMGCNGTVSLKFTTPVYLWLLENM